MYPALLQAALYVDVLAPERVLVIALETQSKPHAEGRHVVRLELPGDRPSDGIPQRARSLLSRCMLSQTVDAYLSLPERQLVRPVEAARSGWLATIAEVALDSTLPGRRSPAEVPSWVKTPRFKVNKPRPVRKVGDALDTERLEGARGRASATQGGRGR